MTVSDDFQAWLFAGLDREYQRRLELELAMLQHETLWAVPVGPVPAMLRWPHLYAR